MLFVMLQFQKYQGTGNDFIIIDDRSVTFDHTNQQLIQRMCDRKFGIGADGLMLLRPSSAHDFTMVYFNSDGRTSSMCGNGGRCLVDFAFQLGVIQQNCVFEAIDGLHEARISEEGVALRMVDVSQLEHLDDGSWFLDTGSPHVVAFKDSLDTLNLVDDAHAIRYNTRFKEHGTNVNFVAPKAGGLMVRTYERGVEDETLSCGTGVTAVALAAHRSGIASSNEVFMHVQGGELMVRFDNTQDGYSNIWLIGPATHVFNGNYSND